jgi:AraC-like DNA-binding protein
MITTTEIAPAPVLAPYIRCYTYREFNTNGVDLIKPWHATHEITIPFFFKDQPRGLNNPHTGQIIKGEFLTGVTGLGTQYNGEMTFNGDYAFFEIIFKPNGFNKLFRIPASEITNFIFGAPDIFDAGVSQLYEKLAETRGITDMAALADTFLLSQFQKRKNIQYKDAITSISNLILKKAGFLNMDQLANDANMSKRNFQRRFTEQVGMSPKLFCNITRFNHAFDLKLRNARLDWNSIAFDCGYFDQTHLIKDFKKFAGNCPTAFLNQTPLTDEKYNSRIDI